MVMCGAVCVTVETQAGGGPDAAVAQGAGAEGETEAGGDEEGTGESQEAQNCEPPHAEVGHTQHLFFLTIALLPLFLPLPFIPLSPLCCAHSVPLMVTMSASTHRRGRRRERRGRKRW